MGRVKASIEHDLPENDEDRGWPDEICEDYEEWSDQLEATMNDEDNKSR